MSIWDTEENRHSCCDPFWQRQKKKQEWIGQWEKTICLLLSLNRYSLGEQLCQCKTIAFLPSLVLPLPPQGHTGDGSAERSSALCKTSRPRQGLWFCLKLLKEVAGSHQQMERWGGESQVAGDGEELGESQPGPGNTCLECPRGSEGTHLAGADKQFGRRFLFR